MSLHFGSDLLDALAEQAEVSERVWLVSGFIKSGFLERLKVPKKKSLEVYSRWRLNDLVGGGSDVEAAAEVLSRNGSFSVHPRLHAKVFVFDKVAFVGSANLTASGLPTTNGSGNLEASFRTAVTPEILKFMQGIRDDSLRLTADLLEKFEKEINQKKLTGENGLTDSFTKMPMVYETHIRNFSERPFSGADFPWCESPEYLMTGDTSDAKVAHDLELFSLSMKPSFPEICTAFLSSRCYSWLKATLEMELRFGALSSELHDVLNGDPKPYRREVKSLLVNLLSWSKSCDDSFVERKHKHTSSFSFAPLENSR